MVTPFMLMPGNYLDPNAYAYYSGVNPNPSPAPSGMEQAFWNMGQSVLNGMPIIGPLLGAGMNMIGQAVQNKKQAEFYEDYMSPQARMRQMKEAGINPNAAAQGISGAAAPQMQAAAPTNAFSGIGEQLGNSVNNMLSADLISANVGKTKSETNLINSQDVFQNITNLYAERHNMAILDKEVADGNISKEMAYQISVDSRYKEANAFTNYQQLLSNLNQTAAQIEQLNAATIREYATAYAQMMAGSLSEAEIHKVFSDIGLNNAMIQKIEHEIPMLDATTAAQYQNIDESRAREYAQIVQNNFQSAYYNIFRQSGYDANQGIDASIMMSYAQGNYKQGNHMMQQLGNYIVATGGFRAASKDYKIDKTAQIMGSVIGAASTLGGAMILKGGVSHNVIKGYGR